MEIFNSERKNRSPRILLEKKEGMDELLDILTQQYEIVFMSADVDFSQQRNIDVVIVSAHTAACNDFALFSRMKENALTASVPVLIYCSGAEEMNLAYDCLDHGAVDVIRAPLDGRLITNRIRNAIRLEDSATIGEIERMLKVLPSNIYLKDAQGKYVFATHYWHHLDHADDPDWTIRGKTDIEIRKDKDNARKAMDSDLEILQSGVGTTYTIEINKDGVQEFFELIKEPIVDDDQNVVGIIGLINNVTDMELLRISLEEKALRDELTGLDNRYGFDRFVHELEMSSQFPISVISADCNDLKVINDTYGHAVGDEYIRMASLLFKMIVPEDSHIFRVGGDEFVMIIPNTSEEQAKGYVESLKEEASHFRIKDRAVSIAYGIACMDDRQGSILNCLELADQNMYLDKRNSKRKMKTIRVVAAVICDDLEKKHEIFATARGYGDFKGQWEFPGGKIEPGELPEEALKREIREELDTEIEVGELIQRIEYDYPTFHLSMDCFWAVVKEGDLVLKEAAEARWLTRDTLESVHWLPADLSLVEKIGQALV